MRECAAVFLQGCNFSICALFRTAAASCDLYTHGVTARLSFGGASEQMCSAEVKSGSLGETFLAIWRIDVTGLSGPRGQIQAASHTNCFCGREHQESNLLVLKRFLFSTPSPPFNNPICL